MLDWISAYYGIDLLATAFTFWGIYQLGNQKKNGFVIHIIGNIIWLAIAIMSNSFGLLIANIAFAILNIQGFYKWRKNSKNIMNDAKTL